MGIPVKDELRNGLKQTRLRLGLSQQDLATMAGVSRQTISGVESGQTALSVTVALRLAKALGCRVEDLFWIERDRITLEATPTATPPTGDRVPVSLVKVGGQWIAHPLVGNDAFRLELIAADGEAIRQPDRETLTVALLDDPANLLNTVAVAGCAPALSLWAQAAERWHPGLRVHLSFANSTAALEQLARGEVHIAGVHLYCPKTQTFNLPFVRQALPQQATVLINLGLWQEGLVVAAGNPKGIEGVADLSRPDITLVNREPGAGSRELLDQALAEAQLMPHSIRGFDQVVLSHQAVAQAIAQGRADVGVSAASVAATYNLGFLPLRQSRYDLVTLKAYLDEPAVQQLLGTLSHRRVLSQLERLGGYDTHMTGDVVASIPGTDPEAGSG
ncbi:MAG TPA: helix-turn-helix domain-containing protein [Leptolyngbyaceae cyanobacterium M65_K2018_010]|nr:helix-turn-helix domain-containing protein [Leptolyngbyaceae cyanobacterium M65_K2018_010]